MGIEEGPGAYQAVTAVPTRAFRVFFFAGASATATVAVVVMVVGVDGSCDAVVVAVVPTTDSDSAGATTEMLVMGCATLAGATTAGASGAIVSGDTGVNTMGGGIASVTGSAGLDFESIEICYHHRNRFREHVLCPWWS